MSKGMIAAIIVVVGFGLVIGGFWYSSSNNVVEAPSQQELDGVTEPKVTTFSLEEIAVHNTKDDCWTAIGGSVYDITSYIPSHPGSDEVLRACGTDGTSLFGTRTTNDGKQIGSGTPHSSDAFSILGPFYIGDFVN